MKIISAPTYNSFLTQCDQPFFSQKWNEYLSVLMLDLDWIDELGGEPQEFSKNYEHEDFPTFWNWPQKWRDDYDSAEQYARDQTKLLIKDAEKHIFGQDTLYILDDSEQVFFSTPHYDYSHIYEMSAVGDYDSAITAAYVFLNEYKRWSKKHKKNWDAANILSGATPRGDVYSAVGISAECDYCGNVGLIVATRHDNDICQHCFKS